MKSTPLVSIDLIVLNSRNEVLLGLRTNAPARDSWFVPGGRIYKNESIAAAFGRLCLEELGLDSRADCAEPLGLFEHLYPDSHFDDRISTHYVVAAFLLRLDPDTAGLPDSQHLHWRWWSLDAAQADKAVHPYTQDYLARLPRR
ncbi:MAG TPA: NUDIX domain-containing protein [Solimonas sp.]